MKKKTLWLACINRGGGLHYNEPIPLKWSKVHMCWIPKEEEHGDYAVDEPGMETLSKGYACQFTSFNKKDVELFILGALSLINCCLRHFEPKGLPK